jgi:hypothetical protein
MIYIDGVYQEQGTYSVSGTTLTFTEAPPTNASIEVVSYKVTAIGTTDANSVTYLPAGTSAVQTTVQTKLRETVSVKDFGAVGDGVTDDTAAFSAACQAVVGAVPFDPQGISRSVSASVYVPAGTYLLSSIVDTGNKDITYVFELGVEVPSGQYLNGRVDRKGISVSSPAYTTYGTDNNAVGSTFRLGFAQDDGAEIMSFSNPNQLASYDTRDSVAKYTDIVGLPPLATLAGASYTATTVVPTSPLGADILRQLKIGMIIDTNHSPNRFSGFITSWASDGTSITVSGWYEVTGVAGSPSTPSGTATAYLNPITKVWATNTNVFLNSSSHADACVAVEYGIFDNKAASTAVFGGTHYAWGNDVINLGTYKVQALYVARGGAAGAFAGYRADGIDTAFYAKSNTSGTATQIIINDGTHNRFAVKDDGTIEVRNSTGGLTNKIEPTGRTERGSLTAASAIYDDYHTSGNNNDYDVRTVASSGSASAGQGVYQILAGTTLLDFHRPAVDAGANVGSAGFRYNTIFAANGTINTSDQNDKRDIQDITESELRVATALKSKMKSFRFNLSYEEKGEDARIHFGIIAQDVRSAFEAEGLDPTKYGVFCSDTWTDDDGVEHTRLGVRYSQLFAFIIAAL